MKNLFLTTVLLLIGIASFSQNDCTGQRVSIQSLELDDRIILNQLILDYVQSEINSNYDPEGEWPNNILENKYDIVAQHTDYNSGMPQPWHGPTETFFSWHRDYVAGLEQYILDQGCDICADLVPLPYWDITEPLSDPFYNSMIPEFAVEDALLTAPQPLFITPQSETWGDFTLPMNESPCVAFENIDDYAEWMLGRHAQVHFEMGGAMRSFASTAGTAVFWLYHAYIDEKYYCYQQECQCPVPVAQLNIRKCDVCFDLASSINSDEYRFTLIDDLGNETNISLNSMGCISSNYLDQGEDYTLKIKAINSSMLDNVDCLSDQIEVEFTAPDPPSTKFDPIPCAQILVEPNVPASFENGMKITNMGPKRAFSFANTVLITGLSTSIGNTITLNENEEISISIPLEIRGLGINYFSIFVDGESLSFEYINQ